MLVVLACADLILSKLHNSSDLGTYQFSSSTRQCCLQTGNINTNHFLTSLATHTLTLATASSSLQDAIISDSPAATFGVFNAIFTLLPCAMWPHLHTGSGSGCTFPHPRPQVFPTSTSSPLFRNTTQSHLCVHKTQWPSLFSKIQLETNWT